MELQLLPVVYLFDRFYSFQYLGVLHTYRICYKPMTISKCICKLNPAGSILSENSDSSRLVTHACLQVFGVNRSTISIGPSSGRIVSKTFFH